MDSVNVAFVGHSYVKKIDIPDFYEGERRHFNIKSFSIPGAKIHSFYSHAIWESIREFKPKLVFLLIGGNDIPPKMSTKTFVSKVKDLIVALQELGDEDCFCYFFTLELRVNPRNTTPSKYKSFARGVNKTFFRKQFFKRRVMGNPVIGKPHNVVRDGIHPSLSAIADFREKIYSRLNKWQR